MVLDFLEILGMEQEYFFSDFADLWVHVFISKHAKSFKTSYLYLIFIESGRLCWCIQRVSLRAEKLLSILGQLYFLILIDSGRFSRCTQGMSL